MRLKLTPVALALTTLSLAACGDSSPDYNVLPASMAAPAVASYDGASDDLLTGGLGWDGLLSASGPTLSATPTSAELRKRAIWTNYRALVDMSYDLINNKTLGGYGVLYGPNVPPEGMAYPAALLSGKIPGKEYLTYADDGSGRKNVTLMVQIPSHFDKTAPCIVTATSSGSRGVYGAVSAAGEWGLKRGCAVAYTDKGTGNGAHELDTNIVTLYDGRLSGAATAGNASHFTAQPGSGTTLAAYAAAFPHRYAFKHAHSQQNPEKDWGANTLRAVEFALYAINEEYGNVENGRHVRTFKPDNTVVIASSVSNGGGAALAAAEQDTSGLIDAVVVGEPQINVKVPAGLAVKRGGNDVASFGKPLFDYTSLAHLLQPCAAWAPSATGSPFQSSVTNTGAAPFAENRCAALASAGLITGATFSERAADALAKIHAAGWEAESDLLHASMFAFATPAIAVTYANAYARASVTDNLCGYSFATTGATGAPAAPAASPMLSIFANGNGVPPTNGINLIFNDASAGAINYALADGNFAYAGAACIRNLLTDAGTAGTTARASVDAIKVSANLHGKPGIIVHGRSDALVPVNHTSRAYLGANRLAEGSASKLSYIEVTNGQHFDAFIPFPGYSERFIPMHVYTVRALDAMWSHLKNKTALPPSQVVRTTPRGAGAPSITAANVPAIASAPATGDVITFSNSAVNVPN